ncbi:aldehyde dehydrogenase family protein [Natrarchaeobius oligotrophus]|uniref:Aldehyde dehydrogenase n=1 Tax=Natrarchaeobius chitinivorans TaxID=1679083 RepID=A0A3N6MWH2_NATCH|nr:aldehyde dehydrogenase family protein [Natrarchaeobius chitinivorans]RQH02321.1 aldehyde dehydrogenase [Natrarchaeobius chitinivorans]
MEPDVDQHYEAYVNGSWIEGIGTVSVVDPATEDELATVVEGGEPAMNAAIEAASASLEGWRGIDATERGRTLRSVVDALRAESDRLARIETAEVGRPLRESRGIVTDAIDYFEYYAGMADKIEGETIPVPGDRLDYTRREPLGVTGHVIPWNAPSILAARSIAPALAAGNTVVAKPAPEAPIALLELARIATDAGLPPGVLNMVPGDGPRTGEALTLDDRVDKLVFTGSKAVGKHVMKMAADNVTPVGLELGGNNPCLVFPDASLDGVVDDLLKAYINAGQVCFAPRRVFVHESISDDLVDRLVSRVSEMTVGPGVENPDVGPLIHEEARRSVADAVAEAVDDGARLLTGGERPRDEGYFYAPTVLDGVDDDARLACEEVFGPVLSAFEFSDEASAVERANDTEFGLYAAVYTSTLERAHRVANELEAGSIAINGYPATFPQAPFGGYKESGLGREKGQQAIDHYTQLKNVTVTLGDAPGAGFEKSRE